MAPSTGSSTAIQTSSIARFDAIMQPSTSPIARVLGLLQWNLGLGPAGHYRIEDLEWYEIQISASQWAKLCDTPGVCDNEDRRFPRLWYNTATSILIIQCMPLPMHQSITQMVARAIHIWEGSLSRDQRSNILCFFNEDLILSTGSWAGSEKAPDLGLRVRVDGKWRIKWILEAGFSQTYESLKETARACLEGMAEQVDMVALINIQENPPYHCPLSPDEDPNVHGLPRMMFPEDITCQGSQGPATYQGLTWVNYVDKVSLETWVRGEDGTAKRKGPVKDLLVEATMEIPVGDFSPHHGTIVVDLDQLRERLPDSIRFQACARCQRVVYQWNKRMGDDAQDRDYVA